jgi:hypothetical protein
MERVWLWGAACGAAALFDCREPTQMVVEVFTDVPCPELGGVTISVGPGGDFETREPVATGTKCDASNGRVGSLYVVPSGSPSDEVGIKVVGAIGLDPRACEPPAYGPKCIVARRQLRYIRSHTLRLPVDLRASCAGVACPATQTCVRGRCVNAIIPNPEACESRCDEGSLAPDEDAGAGVDAGADASPEAASDATADATVDAPPVPTPLCDKTDPTLRLCMRFEGSLADESATNLQPALALNVGFVPGREGSAARFSLSPLTDLRYAYDARLATPQRTVEMFIRPASYPATGTRQMLIDLHDETGMMVDPGGILRCRIPDLRSTTAAPLNQWTHFACVQDGAQMTIYVNGVAEGTVASTLGLNVNNTTIGQSNPAPAEQYDGLIDNLRVWSTARTAAQIAAAAAR